MKEILEHGYHVVAIIKQYPRTIIFDLDKVFDLRTGFSHEAYSLVTKLHSATMYDFENDVISVKHALALTKVPLDKQPGLLRFARKETILEFKLTVKRAITFPLTPSLAKNLGFTVDETCYPWKAYIGERSNPKYIRNCLTNLEIGMYTALSKEDRATFTEMMIRNYS